ncbi:DUF4258 domain-containing protein [Methylobacterium sp. W2]|uniref:DUF4258 domain-containing protein n=1 Tax=Methylobacterium sp. W2 TaxID=2598107 RepID=UPI001D0C6C10|nr:DUF4258 domain-containing protein [Methylobacterium sp. W2]MCC0808944.1 DUF4258 domain-containing protein [Methylobacterium sp. W2]
MAKLQPWKPADATDEIRKLARSDKLNLTFSGHARDQLDIRDLFIGDASYVLKHGFVYEHPVEATRPGLFKYRIESRSPNSGNRIVRVIAVPDPGANLIKLVTVMWKDEK